MKSNQRIQYTIRNLTPQLDRTLRQKAREMRQSLNEVVLEAVSRGVGLKDQPVIHHDLDSLAGTWLEDPAFEEALRQQDQVDPKMWS